MKKKTVRFLSETELVFAFCQADMEMNSPAEVNGARKLKQAIMHAHFTEVPVPKEYEGYQVVKLLEGEK